MVWVSWPIFPMGTARSLVVLLLTCLYILKAIKKVLHGPSNDLWVAHINENKFREIALIAPLMVLMLWIGIWPAWILGVINDAMRMLFG